MIIDASLGRASCCGYPCGMQQNPSQPFPPQPQPTPPMPPQPAMPNTLQLQLATAQSDLASGAAIPFSTVTRQTGNGLSFNSATNAFTVNQAGVYDIDWTVLVTATGSNAPVLALQSLDGQTVLGYTGTVNAAATDGTQLTGHTVAMLPAGSSWVLVNASGEAIDVSLAGTAPAAFAASMTVTQVAPVQQPQQPPQSPCGMQM